MTNSIPKVSVPKVSVITPTYNAKGLIEECVRSVAVQTYRNIEHVIVDGNSTDGTKELLVQLFDHYEHLRWVSEPDDGIYDAMNKGIRMSEGEWVYFLGSDDVLKNCDVLTNIFSRHEVLSHDIIYGFNEFGGLNQTFGSEYTLARLIFQNICHQSIFYRKNVFEKYGCFDQTYKSWSDWEINIRLFSNENVATCYLPVLISKYALGGYSTIYRDEKFLHDRPEIIEKYITPKHADAYKELLVQSNAIAWLEQQCVERDDQVRVIERQCKERDDKIRISEQQCLEKEHKIQIMSKQLAGLKQTIETQDNELNLIKSSIIWKIFKKIIYRRT